jgi:predicted permease
VGITDRSFNQFGRSGDLFIPLQLALGNEPPAQTDSTVRRVVTIAGRLTPGVTRQRAQAEVDTLSRQFRISASLDGNGLVLGSTRRLFQPDDLPGAWLPTFGGLGAAAFLILLLACANVGNLQIARSLARRREILVRLSLGAGRARVVRLLLAEASWLTIAATAMGLSCSQLVLAFVPLDSTITAGRLAPTAPVVGFSIGIAALSVLLFALAPALRATDGRSSLVTTRGTGLDPRGRTLRSFLLATQLALSLTLLVSAALLSRGMAHIRHVELGFDSARTAIARLTLPDGRRTPEAADAFISALDPILRSSQLWPAGWTNEPPLTGARLGAWVRRPHEMDSRRRRVQRRSMSPSAFAALGLTFVSGRPYDDRSGGVVINETLARTIWPDAGAVGQSLSIRNVHGEETTQTVAGVVRDSRLTTPAAVEPLVLEPAQGTFGCCPILVFRASTTGAPAALRALIERVDPGVRITTASVVDAGIQEGLEAQRLAATIAWGIGALGLGLATIGVFGVFAQAVEERRSEIAIRLALGAAPRNIVAVMFRANRAPVGGGLAAGLFLSVSAGIAIRAYLFGLSPLDPPSYAVVVGILSATAAIATFIPLRRALRIAPGVALRSE